VIGDSGELVRVGCGCERGHRVELVCVWGGLPPQTINSPCLLREKGIILFSIYTSLLSVSTLSYFHTRFGLGFVLSYVTLRSSQCLFSWLLHKRDPAREPAVQDSSYDPSVFFYHLVTCSVQREARLRDRTRRTIDPSRTLIGFGGYEQARKKCGFVWDYRRESNNSNWV
jgi:hypothetical protein